MMPGRTTKALTCVAADQGLVVAVSTSAPEGIRTPNLLLGEHASGAVPKLLVRAVRLPGHGCSPGRTAGPYTPTCCGSGSTDCPPGAGCPIRLHDLRHSYATAELKAGVKPKIVSQRLGMPRWASP